MHDKIETIKNAYNDDKDLIYDEENTRYSLIDPFIESVLGYDVRNIKEVKKQFTTDFGQKKGFKVDYAIFKDGNPIILLDAEKLKGKLSIENTEQLSFFLNYTAAKIAILTNGYEYRFYTDFVKENIMDNDPFFKFTLDIFDESTADILKMFTKDLFDLDKIKSAVRDLKCIKSIKNYIEEQMTNPSDEFIKLIVSKVYKTTKNKKVLEKFKDLTQKAFNAIILDKISEHPTKDLDKEGKIVNPETLTPLKQKDESEVEYRYSDEEITVGENSIKEILKNHINIDRISIKRNPKSFNFFIDDDEKKVICRIVFHVGKNQLSWPNIKKLEKWQWYVIGKDFNKIHNKSADIIEVAVKFLGK